MKQKLGVISVLVNLFLAAGKIIIGLAVKSSAILAEGVHSGMDVFSSVISLIGIRMSGKPRDEKHPYGHYKFEVVSGLVITLLLFGAGLWMIYEAYLSFVNPEAVLLSYYALGIMVISAVLNEVMARLKIHYGKKENSLSLLSDGVHDRVDVISSIAVLTGLLVMPYWIYIDSILAFLIGLYVLKESFSLGKEATDSLLDVSAGPETENSIRAIADKNNVEVADLKTQKKGSAVTANIVIMLDKSLSVKEAESISDNLRKNLMNEMKNLSYVAIQIESHDIESNYYEPGETIAGFRLKSGMGWRRKGRFTKAIPQASGQGPGGMCACPKCGATSKSIKKASHALA